MKKLFGLFAFSYFFTNSGSLQGQNLQKIEKETKLYRQKLKKQSDHNEIWIDFSVDTFKIEHTLSEKMSVEYRTQGMNSIVADATAEYDKLLNKYYNKLLAKLNSEDKKILISTQKAWIVFRENELKLIGILGKTEYSDGGTMQSNISVGFYHEMVKSRAIEIFQHFYRTVPD